MVNKRAVATLAALACAAIAFAIPAMAHAKGPYWYIDEGGIQRKVGGPEERETFVAHGEVTFSAGELYSDTCAVDTHGYVWNGEAIGEGGIDGVKVTTPCTGTGVCAIQKVDSNIVGPWEIVPTFPDGLDIYNVTLTFTYGPTCPLGTEVSAAGTLTATYPSEGPCIEFNNSGDLESETEEPFEISLSGGLCTTLQGEGTLTLK